MNIPYVRVNPELPAYHHAHQDDAGYDLVATQLEWIMPGETVKIDTNLRIQIPTGHCGLVTGRSSFAAKGIVTYMGTIDAGYTGPIGVVLTNLTDKQISVSTGDRIAQLVILRLPEIELVEVSDLSETERGSNGFGSTGVAK